jgi:hypothetical protein
LRLLGIITFTMRRKAILLTILPLADALSLANFQQITSIFIPITCQLAYDSQIPSCQVSDFNNGCSSLCQSGLISVANGVSEACSDVSVSSSTLLGIVMDGGIIQALCPIKSAKTTATVAKSSSVIAQTPSSVAASVTIPTTSPGVVVAPTPSTTSKSTPSAQSASTTTSTSATTTSSQTTETTESAEGASAAASSTTETTQSTTEAKTTTSTGTKKDDATSTKTTAAATTSKSGQDSETQDSGSGGGSPFDISSSGNRIKGGSMFAFVVAAWGCILLAR